MNKTFFLTAVCIASLQSFVYAQQTAVLSDKNYTYNKALRLFNNKEYSVAQSLFYTAKENSSSANIKTNAAYYIAQSAIRLQQPGADVLMQNFLNDNPTHSKHNKAHLAVGNYYFSIGKYALARKWYEDIDENRLAASDKASYNFNKGYSLYYAKRYDGAKAYFEKVSDNEKYGSQAQYYLGYLAYQDNDYKQADTYFNELEGAKDYQQNVSYYKADRSFKQGEFQKAIDLALEQEPKAKTIDKSELNKIIGESYFNLNQYKTAIPYLKKYRGNRGRWSNTDYYLLGYSYYKTGQYSLAVSQFNKIIGGKNEVSQNAYYHLADAYLQSDQKQQALNAFKNASEMNFKPNIKQNAAYNYAKLSYDIGNSYKSVPAILKDFLEKYPSDVHTEEVSKMLVDSYLSSKDYAQALVVLESGLKKTNQKIYQKVLMYRGLELFKNREFETALPFFEKAIVKNSDSKITGRAQFWKAETLYELNDFKNAVTSYNSAKTNLKGTKEFVTLDYQLGYSYFKLKDYKNAILSFTNYLTKETGGAKAQDATLRLADSYFVSAQYWPAMENYNKAIEQKHKRADYAHYQKAISYGFVNKNNQKIADLERFLSNFKTSNLRDDAYYALANVYGAEQNTDAAVKNYKALQSQYPKSILVAKALLKESLIYYNGNQSEKALQKLKQLVKNHSKTPEALQAVKTARLVYVDLGKTEEYAQWVSTLDFVEITNEEYDNTTYEAAEKPYQNNEYEKAIIGFEKYLKQFPKGLHTLSSHFYLAQLYTNKANTDKALPHYLAVSKMEENEFTETSLYRISQTFLEKKSYKQAIPYLEKLQEIADFPQNIIFALSNLMKSHYEIKDFENTLGYANKVLSNNTIDNEIKIDAHIYKARAALALQQLDVSKKAYAEVSKTATGKLGAEATYHLAYFATESQDFEISNTHVQRLAKEFSAYKNYSAKGLLLMAKNFNGLQDAYQATYVLETLISNFSDHTQVVKEAQVLLQKIKAEEAKSNSSITE